jgi:hypothetical protein
MEENKKAPQTKESIIDIIDIVKELFRFDISALVCFGLLLCCLFTCSPIIYNSSDFRAIRSQDSQKENKITCDEIFAYNKEQRLLKLTALEVFKTNVNQHGGFKDKMQNNLTILNVASNLNRSQFLFKQVYVPFTCKLIYPLSIRGVLNEEEVSLALIIKNLLSIYVAAKIISVILNRFGVAIAIANMVVGFKVRLIRKSLNKTEQSVIGAKKEIEKLEKQIQNQKDVVKVNKREERREVLENVLGINTTKNDKK